jgi:hypothetical protein
VVAVEGVAEEKRTEAPLTVSQQEPPSRFRVKSVLVVVSSSVLEKIRSVSWLKVSNERLSALTPSERRNIPFLRAWVLAEISSACEQSKLLVISCGSCTLDRKEKDRYVFELNTPLLYNTQFLVSMENAEAQFEEDRVVILEDVRQSIGTCAKRSLSSFFFSIPHHCQHALIDRLLQASKK